VTAAHEPTAAGGTAASGHVSRELFDDRIDTNAELGNAASLQLIVRALGYLRLVPGLFAAKLTLATLSLIPGLVTPWIGKIVVDQVLLAKPFDATAVRLPPYIEAFAVAVAGYSPLSIMLAVSALLLLMLLTFGRGGTGVTIAWGRDSATQADLALNSGNSGSSSIVGVTEALVHIRITQRLANHLRTQLLERMAQLPMATLDDHRIGDAVYRVLYDAPRLPGICFGLTLSPLLTIAGVLISLYLIQYSYGAVTPELVWYAIFLVPIGLVATLPVSGVMRRVEQASRAAGTATTNAIEESMGNIRAVQSLGGSGAEHAKIDDRSRESFRRYRHIFVANLGVGFLSTVLSTGYAVFIGIFVTDRIIAGTLSPGDFFVLFGLATSVGGAGLALGTLWIQMQGSVAAVRRVFFFLDQPAEDARATLPPLPLLRHSVRLQSVEFDYPNGQRALSQVDLELRVGEMVAIVGPTGAGKTSLAQLIPGFHAPTRGCVLFDSADIAEHSITSVRAQVTYVFQEHLLLNDSIRNNLLLANASADEAAMREACQTAGVLDFVDALPAGLDTVLGNAGDTLSVGQKQRLCIARGLVRNTPVLILDEPTAALDPVTENALVEALHTAARGRLVVVIAHRLSTIRRADRIVFLDGGRVLSVGSHAELMADLEGPYRRFVLLQGGTA